MELVELKASGVKIYEAFEKAYQIEDVSNASTIRYLQVQKEKFQLWARSLGLFQQGHASLDYRVRDAFLVKQPLSSMLQMLLENLEELSSIILGERRPFEEQRRNTSNEEDNEPDDEDGNEELGHSDSESSNPSSSDTQSDSGDSFREAEYRLQLIDEAINSLYCLATKVRNPKNRPQRSLEQMYKHIPSSDRAVQIHELEHLETMVVAYVQRQQVFELLENVPESDQQNLLSQYCLEDSWMIRRVGIANARRRLQFAYWKQHARRLGDPAVEPRENLVTKEKHKNRGIALATGSVENQGQSLNQPMRSAPQQSIATSATKIPPDLLNPQDATSVISYQSRVSTVFNPKGDKVTWPSPPHITKGSNFFSCPYCLLLCPDRYLSSDSWRNHLIHDLQPYHCTYESCKDPNRLYSSRQEWIDHESQHTRVWHCQPHAKEFETQPEYVEHLQQHHEDTKTEHFSAELLSSVAGPSTRPRRECPFCPTTIDSLIELQRHLAFHLERLAILALPRDESDMDTNRGRNVSSESHEALQRGRKRSVCEDFEVSGLFTINADDDPSSQVTAPPNLTEDNLEKEHFLTSVSTPVSYLSLWLDGIDACDSLGDYESGDTTDLAEQDLGPMPTDLNNGASRMEHKIDTNFRTFYAELPASTLATQDGQSRSHPQSLYVTLERLHLSRQFIHFLEQVEDNSEASPDLPLRSPLYQPPEQPSTLAPGGSEYSELPRAQGYVEYLGPLNETSVGRPSS